jgi:predicted TIM-barrel fold metal-dependent hydrolase
MMWFDVNSHMTSTGTWLNGRAEASLANLRDSMTRTGVTRALLVGLAGVNSVEEILRAASTDPRFLPVVGADPAVADDHGGAESWVASLGSRGVRGIKIHCRLSATHPYDSRVLDLLTACARNEMPVLFCSHLVGLSPPAPPISEIADRYLREIRALKLLIVHGGLSAAISLFEIARHYPGCYLDLSFTINRYAGSSVDADLRFLMSNLDQKLMLGSDFPEVLHAEVLDRFRFLAREVESEKLENIRYRNADRFFGLEGDI